jgi:hypothetical protein
MVGFGSIDGGLDETTKTTNEKVVRGTGNDTVDRTSGNDGTAPTHTGLSLANANGNSKTIEANFMKVVL